jgi:peptidyl-prolyl cis-trans isomerase A (cyclophilin A)
MTSGKNAKRQRKKQGRQARIGEQLRAQRARKRRRTGLLVGLLAVVVVAFVFLSQNRDDGASRAGAEPQFATFVTSKGDIKVRLLPEAAPKTVENFVDLATGAKEWTDPRTGEKTMAPLYNNTIFHRVIPEFMIQGGDPLGTGTGGPGYQFEDETEGGPSFDKPGLLAMANSGPDTNGSQFFITVSEPTHLNGRHTIFGEVVEGQSVAEEISKAPTAADKPLEDVVLREVRITSE